MIEGPSQPLHLDDLASLARVLAEVRAPVSCAPPASDQDLARLEAALGRALPDDVKTFYRWHDGVTGLTPYNDLFSTAKAAAEYQDIRNSLGDAWEAFPQLEPGDLVPLVKAGDDYLMVRCGQSHESPIYSWSYWGAEPVPRYASVLHMVKVIEQAWRSQAFYEDYDAWHQDEGRLRVVEDSFQPLLLERREVEARARCALARDTHAPRMERQIALRHLTYERAAIPTLIALLDDDDAEVVRHSAFALGEMHARDAMPHLLKLLERSPRVAADALAAVLTPADTSVVAILLPLLAQDDKQARIAALAALAAIRSPDAVPAVIDVLRDPDAGLYAYAIRALARTRDRRAVEPLRALLERRNSLGLDPVHRGGTRGSLPTPEGLRATIETALEYILAS